MRNRSGLAGAVLVLGFAGVAALLGVLPSGNVGTGQLPGIVIFGVVLVGVIFLFMWVTAKLFGGGRSDK